MTDTTLVQRLRERGEFMGGRLVTTIDGHTMHQAADEIDRLTAELAEARKVIERANILVRLLTVRQVIDAGDRAVEAAGLNPWCMNEGLADGSERISPSFLASKGE